MAEDRDRRNSQLLKGVLDMCLLAIIAEESSYGYEMVQKMEDRGLELVGEGSIYPLLSRLQKAGYIEGYTVPSKEGPRRKYYRSLPAGRDKLQEWVEEWYYFSEAVGRVLREGIRIGD